jgi:hypothetical protein
MSNEFSCFWYDPDGNCHKEHAFVSAREAVQMAHSLSTRPAAKMGVIRRIVITDGDDFTVFLWEDGAIKFPHTSQQDAKEMRHDH